MSDRSELLKKSLLALENAKAKIQQLERTSQEAIAIIGMACRFPGGADSIDQFWEILDSGLDAVTDTLEARWQFKDGLNSHSAGLLSQITDFDAEYFKISAEEAKQMDPQQRVLLETTSHAIADSGYDIAAFNQRPVGVFIGLMNHDYAELTVEPSGYTGSGTASSIASGRLSYCFGLTGPSLTLDTACSSSLVALHYASQSLRQRECEAAIVGGVNLLISPQRMLTMEKANMLSKIGRCHAFAAAADGYVRSEGCAVLILKRLSDAIAAQDNILAIIRGSAVNQDGRSQGLTAPNGPAQQAVITQALACAQITASEVSYVEAHGTGTPLGDPVEINALQAVYGCNRPAHQPLLLGAVKTNIGHTESAAGMAGIIKVILALYHERLPANLHFQSPNPHIDWDQVNIKLLDRSTSWPKQSSPRIAGVSSFGFSGTNAHVLIAEAPELSSGVKKKRPLYPFQRQYYWLDKPGLNKLLLPNDQLLFQAYWNQDSFPYLSDHRVLGHWVVPAASYIEWLMQVIAEVLKEHVYSLVDCMIHEPLLLTGQVKLIQVLFTPYATQGYSIELYSERNHRHFSATLQPQLSSTKPPLEQQGLEAISAELLYQVAEYAGVHYGPNFKLITSLRQNKRSVAAELLPAASITQSIDACLQSLTLVLYGIDMSMSKDYCYLPVSVSRITLAELLLPSAPLQVRAEISVDLPAYSEAHIQLLTSSGVIILTMEKVRFQKVSHTLLQQRLKVATSLQHALYQLTWQQQVCYSRIPLSLYFDWIEEKPSLVQLDKIDPFMPDLEYLSLQIMINNLARLGWNFAADSVVSLPDFIVEAGIIDSYLPLLERMVHLLAQHKYLLYTPLGWTVSDQFKREDVATLAEQFRQGYAQGHAELELLMKSAEHLHSVLTGQIDPLQLLFHTDSSVNAEHAYQHAQSMQRLHEQLIKSITQLTAHLPAGQGLRILEIGAGTGSTTAALLTALVRDKIEYYFTDISPLFLQKAEIRFAAYSGIRYQILDIEKDPVAQGFDLHSFDVIIASNVLHATRSLSESLLHIQQLLAAKGVLLLLEQTQAQAWLDLTFGLTQGWWRFADKTLRPQHPLLTRDQWLTLLKAQGFRAIEMGHEYSAESVLIAQSEQTFVVPPHDKILVLANESDFCQAFIKRLQELGIMPIYIYQDAASVETLSQLLRSDVGTLISFWSMFRPTLQELYQSSEQALLLIQQLLTANAQHIKLWLVTTGAQAVGETSIAEGVFHAPIWGIVKSLGYEHPELQTVCVDVEGQDPAQLIAELFSSSNEDQIAYRHGSRWVARLDHYPERSDGSPWEIKKDVSYLVAGGHNGIGLLTVEWLFSKGARHFVVFGRTTPSQSNAAIIARLQAQGATISVNQADICDEEQLKRLINNIDPPLRGIIDAVGVLDDGILLQQNWQRMTQVMQPKVIGTWNLHRLTQNMPLDFFVMYSSIASLIGSAGQSNHAAANAFLDQFCFYRKQLGLPATTINWGVWSEVGAAESRGVGARLQAQNSGIGIISPEMGRAFLDKIWLEQPTQIGVFPMDWQAFAAAFPTVMAKPYFSRLFKQTNEAHVLPKSSSNLLILLNQAKGIKQQRRLLLNHLQAKVALLLKIDSPQSLKSEHRLFELGLDSLMAVELRDYLQRELQKKLPPTLLFDYPTLGQLVTFIVQTYFDQASDEKDIMQLSDDEAEALLLRELNL